MNGFENMSDRDLLIQACTEIKDMKETCKTCTGRIDSIEKRIWGAMGAAVVALLGAVWTVIKRW